MSSQSDSHSWSFLCRVPSVSLVFVSSFFFSSFKYINFVYSFDFGSLLCLIVTPACLLPCLLDVILFIKSLNCNCISPSAHYVTLVLKSEIWKLYFHYQYCASDSSIWTVKFIQTAVRCYLTHMTQKCARVRTCTPANMHTKMSI